ncbi:MAG TPA: hypothetical protein VHY22_07065 [Chthoniobacteraceae bacterium]|jgi:hypothetical protein|nr:hypothetical protein [Chthoniobacteraceae bacterium]
MKYEDFRKTIEEGLRASPGGLTWEELRTRLRLPYDRACPEWTRRLEREIGLRREKRTGRAFVWSIFR